jgi:hypothetical protein
MNPKQILLSSKAVATCLLASSLFFASCKKDKSIDNPVTEATTETTVTEEEPKVQALAAIANEGYGAAAVGGANSSTVYHVTNLNSSGAGSLANGIGSNRTIVFDVSGTITGRFLLSSVSYLTIDGAGQNVTINNNNNGDAISIDGSNAHHIIVKNLHVTNAGNDGINVVDGAHDIVITNCTSWGNRDGNIDIAGGTNVTVQYCIIGGGTSGWSGSMLITAQGVSVHHNLFAPVTSGEVGERAPLVHANYSPVGSPNADIRNNLIWKWGRSGGTGSGYGTCIAYNATANVINNYYYSSAAASSAIMLSDYGSSGTGGVAYAAGNVSGNTGVNPNSVSNHAIYAIPSAAAVVTQDACTAAAMVVANAGPTTRTSVDLGYINVITLNGCSGTTPPPVTNQAPTVSAGSNKTITLPTNSVTLTGTASDADGTIASYAWTKVSGPTATIASPSAISTNITGLVAGSYVFNLKVTDDDGATANANVTVTVSSGTPPPNQVPVVSAGSNKTITLPTNSVTLTGTASDADGTITSYVWTKVSGGVGVIAIPTALSTNITGLVAGTYVFNLKVTDNGGATANSNVTVTVNAATTPPPGGSYGTLAYTQLYDVSSSVNTNQGRRNSVSFTKFKTGPGSFRSEVRAGDASLSGGFRSEMAYTGTEYNPTEGVVEYDVYFENWTGLDGGGGTIAWNPGTSGAGSIVSLQNFGGKFDVVRAIGSSVVHQSGTLMNVLSNTWYKMRWEFKWSTGTDGYVRLYIDNVLYYSFTGKTADGSGQTFKIGQNRWPSSGSTMQKTSVCYYDNLKIYRK